MDVSYCFGAAPASSATKRRFRAVLIGEKRLGIDARAELCRALIDSGCLYLMCWGQDAEAWQDAMNLANLQAWEYGRIPDDQLVIATSHPRESLDDVFWYAKHTALHPCDPLDEVWLIHIAETADEDAMLERFAQA